ncbi:SMP-30/gluconolactonase/LRE family protein [Celeribacter indicus]|uniref:SMP-30/gluconolaconase/LRE domain-containing protein n=1 Tax=Celeribacter indicus TaxID=1208324 RepID=A0A0B5DUR9_9RHOB|nr:SMP-30/gluconolactonase/LRE family protein [Celeribacter indicus]AJE46774.1 SMP-30/gluconolaconase/LRE domain-containing protein [Celeribacter indicus]SDX06092.1 gluconolactonase [Celeribacter indicus]
MWFSPPPEVSAKVWTRMPAGLRRQVSNDWTRANFPGGSAECFLEGPCFDEAGRLHLVNIPHGEVIAVEADRWDLVVAYDGLPNGMKFLGGSEFMIADHKRGLVRLDAAAGRVEDVLTGLYSEPFKGLNDLTLHEDGSILFTDQGQTGLHDPTGRVFRRTPEGRIDRLLSNAPSPNGLVLDRAQRMLFVAMTRSCEIWMFALKDGAEITKAQCFCRLPGGRTGPDGLTMDGFDRLYMCSPGHQCVWVVAPDGRPCLRILGPEGAVITNCAFAPDGRTLFMTSAFGDVLVCEVPAPG